MTTQLEARPALEARDAVDGFLFVSGCKRAATEFLNHSFDGHPDLLNVVVEFYAFEYVERFPELAAAVVEFAERAPVGEVYESFRRRNFLPCFDARNLRPGLWPSDNHGDDAYFAAAFDLSGFLERFEKSRAGGLGSVQNLVHKWLDCLRRTPPFSQAGGRSRWLLKCADFGLSITVAHQLALLDRSVFSVRDPLAIVASIKRLRMGEAHRDFHVFELLEICRMLEAVPGRLEALGDRVLTLRLEDLTRAPEQTLRRVCTFFGIGWHPCLERPTLLGTAWDSNTSFTSAGEARDVLTATEARLVIDHTETYRAAFGYGPATRLEAS